MSPRVVVTAVVASAAVTAAALVWRTQPADPGNPVVGSGNVLDGAALFRSKGCATCHNGPDTTTDFAEFPDLSNAPEWAGERRPGMSAADYVAESIRQPGAFTSPAFQPFGPTTGMPDLDVSDEEVDALVAYLLAD